MLKRRLRTPLIVTLFFALGATPAEAQFRDLIDRVKADINDLKFADAVRRGQEIFAFTSAMTKPQLIELRSVMAAAYFPDEADSQKPDSAMVHLQALIKLDPEAVLPTDVRWPGLDSLFAVARSQTFAVAVKHAEESILIGTDGRGFVDVISTRPAVFYLRIAPLAGGEAVLHDSATATTRGRLAYRAHDGTKTLLSTGEYNLIVTAIDTVTRDSVMYTNKGTATGEVPVLSPPPTFDEKSLKPESSKPPRVRTAFTGIFYTALTFAIASQGRTIDPALKSAYGTDSRATMIGVAMIGATAFALWKDKGTPSRENILANARAREDHRRAVTDAEAENRRRIAAYRVSMRVAIEGR